MQQAPGSQVDGVQAPSDSQSPPSVSHDVPSPMYQPSQVEIVQPSRQKGHLDPRQQAPTGVTVPHGDGRMLQRVPSPA